MFKNKYKRSRQREEILKILKHTDTHPTASWIYDELKNDFKNLSMGTVYRNLNILMDQSMITKIESGSGFDRFDGNIDPHYHFICRECESVFDLDIPVMENLNEQVNAYTDHQVKDHRISFYGLCANCKEETTLN